MERRRGEESTPAMSIHIHRVRDIGVGPKCYSLIKSIHCVIMSGLMIFMIGSNQTDQYPFHLLWTLPAPYPTPFLTFYFAYQGPNFLFLKSYVSKILFFAIKIFSTLLLLWYVWIGLYKFNTPLVFLDRLLLIFVICQN